MRTMIRTVVMLLWIGAIMGTQSAFASEDVSLRFQETASPLTAYGHYLENELDVRVTSQGGAQAASESVNKDESTTTLDTRKRLELLPLKEGDAGEGTRSFYVMNEKVAVLRADGQSARNASGQTRLAAMRMDALGNPQAPTSLVDFAYASFPIILPEDAVREGSHWGAALLVMTPDGSELDVHVTYTLTHIAHRDGRHIADIEYRLAGELTSTDVTDDASKLTRIDEMRRRGLEKISLSGTGRVGFDIDRHLPAIHVTDLILETAGKSIAQSQMVQREKTVEMHKAEAILAL